MPDPPLSVIVPVCTRGNGPSFSFTRAVSPLLGHLRHNKKTKQCLVFNIMKPLVEFPPTRYRDTATAKSLFTRDDWNLVKNFGGTPDRQAKSVGPETYFIAFSLAWYVHLKGILRRKIRKELLNHLGNPRWASVFSNCAKKQSKVEFDQHSISHSYLASTALLSKGLHRITKTETLIYRRYRRYLVGSWRCP